MIPSDTMVRMLFNQLLKRFWCSQPIMPTEVVGGRSILGFDTVSVDILTAQQS
jgi:hypothetical protein